MLIFLPICGTLVLCTKLLTLIPYDTVINIFSETEWSEFFINSNVSIIFSSFCTNVIFLIKFRRTIRFFNVLPFHYYNTNCSNKRMTEQKLQDYL